MLLIHLFYFLFFFFFKQKTAYEMRISDWSSDVCSSDLVVLELLADQLLRLALVRRYEEGPGFDAEPERLPLAVEHDPNIASREIADRIRVQIGRAACRERWCQSV